MSAAISPIGSHRSGPRLRVSPMRIAMALVILGSVAVLVSSVSLPHAAGPMTPRPALPPGSALPAWLALGAGGLLAGWLAGLLGIGGALVTLPTLYLALPALGVAAAQVGPVAVATALCAMVPTTVVAAWRHHRHGALDLRWWRRLAPLLALGAVLGASASGWATGPWCGLAFAAQSVWYGARLMREALQRGVDADAVLARQPARVPAWLAVPLMAAFCAAVGMGCGSLVPRYLQRRGVGFRSAVATCSALNLCIAFGGVLAFSLAGRPGAAACWPAALVLGFGSMCAAPLGVACAHRLPLPALRAAVAAVNLLSAVVLLAAIVRP